MTVIDRPAGREAYVMDLVVFSSFRRRGFARAALPLVEKFAAQLGLTQVSLSVATENSAARSLYDTAGFRPVFTRMTKKFALPSSPV